MVNSLVCKSAVVAAIVTVFASLSLVSASVAGSGNVLYLEQDSSNFAAAGEAFSSDQTLSSNSSIGAESAPAVQRGNGDSANIMIDSQCGLVSESCGHAGLTQVNDFSLALADHPRAAQVLWLLSAVVSGNSATVSVSGQGSGTVSQYGFGNQASLFIDASEPSALAAQGSITQVGLGNQASLRVALTGSSTESADVSLNQYGIGNKAELGVKVPGGQSVSYTQIGVGLNYYDPTVVISTTGSVSVTQTNFGFTK